MAVPYTFGTATAAIPLSQLDSNFATAITLGNTAMYLGNTTTTVGNLTLTNVTISSGTANVTANITYGTANAVVYSNASNVGVTSANLTFNGTTLTIANNPTLTAGTANGVAYLNGSKVLTSGSALSFDGTALTSLNNSSAQSIVLSRTSAVARNWALGVDGDGGFRLTDTTGSVVVLSVLPSGVAYLASESELAFRYNSSTEGMRLTSTGLGIGTSSPSFKLHVSVGSENTALFQNSSSSPALIRFRDTGTTTDPYVASYGNSMAFGQYGGSEFARFTSTGLGIGTSSPATELDVQGASSSSTNWIWAGGNAANPPAGCTYGVLLGRNLSGGFSEANIVWGQGISSNQFLGIGKWTGSAYTEQMRIDSSGNVGIGTNAPSGYGNTSKLAVQTASSTNGIVATFANSGSTGAAIQLFQSGVDTATIGMPAGSNGLTFAPSSTTERMRLDASGNLLVGTTTASGKLYVTDSTNPSSDQSIFFENTNAGFNKRIVSLNASRNATSSEYQFLVCSISGVESKFIIQNSGNAQNRNNSYGAISDEKLKENIVDATPKLADLMQVKIRNFNFKTSPQEKQIGVVAQELETIFPSLIDESRDCDEEGNDLGTTTKAVKYSVFVPMLIKAIQELKAEFDAYKASHP